MILSKTADGFSIKQRHFNAVSETHQEFAHLTEGHQLFGAIYKLLPRYFQVIRMSMFGRFTHSNTGCKCSTLLTLITLIHSRGFAALHIGKSTI